MTTTAPASAGPRSLLDRTDANRAGLATVALPHAIVAGGVCFVLIALIVGLVVNWPVGLIVGLLVGGGAGFAALKQVPQGSRAKVDAAIVSRPAPEAEFPRYHNLIEGLTLNSGAQRPELRVVDDPALNAAAYGSPDDGVVIVTTGLLESLERIELEGVLAEALVRLRSHDAEMGMQIAAIRSFGLLSVTAADPDLASKAKAAERLAAVVADKLGGQREFLSDLAAVDVTRYPPGLGAAFIKMESASTTVSSATLGTAHLWLIDPIGASEQPEDSALGVFRPAAPLSQRIMLMEEL